MKPWKKKRKKVQSSSISIVAMIDDDGEGDAVREVAICHKNALSPWWLSEWCGLPCLYELPEVRKDPASITWTVALL